MKPKLNLVGISLLATGLTSLLGFYTSPRVGVAIVLGLLVLSLVVWAAVEGARDYRAVPPKPNRKEDS